MPNNRLALLRLGPLWEILDLSLIADIIHLLICSVSLFILFLVCCKCNSRFIDENFQLYHVTLRHFII